MITAQDMIKKVGKRRFVETAIHSQPKQTGAYLSRLRRFGRNIKSRMCEHGVWVIENYERRPCLKCGVMVVSSSRHFEPYFNAGLGVYITSKGEERKISKRMGLREAGWILNAAVFIIGTAVLLWMALSLPDQKW